MRYAISCPPPDYPIVDRGTIQCTNNNTLTLEPIFSGIGDLAWSDVSILIGALFLSASIATAWNILGKMFYRG
ncbi:hypothetical protein [Nitrosomonas sp.]|uniref:hypothetical protein n=1 Tax=Nitrosomonas sp. TaxID=42353 RepID=UPI002851ABE5|nr:hypothetical protein [Nitrosomonas sp.]MDR4513153.1 hypothetical protein [Nitrosomonas sp.]